VPCHAPHGHSGVAVVLDVVANAAHLRLAGSRERKREELEDDASSGEGVGEAIGRGVLAPLFREPLEIRCGVADDE
jgi:hypothetical protein